MMRLNVDWIVLSPARVPEGVRASLERRLEELWRFLDCSRLTGLLGCRSEEFEMNVDEWTFTYEIDLGSGAAIVKQILDHPVWCDAG